MKFARGLSDIIVNKQMINTLTLQVPKSYSWTNIYSSTVSSVFSSGLIFSYIAFEVVGPQSIGICGKTARWLLLISSIILPMWNGFPEIQHNSSRDLKDNKEKKQTSASPGVSYRGITLKEYFRLCEQTKPNETLKQIKEESRASSNSSLAETPTFNQQDNVRHVRTKIKTEVCEVENQNFLKNSCGRAVDCETRFKAAQTHSLEKNQKVPYLPLRKKDERKKVFTKIHSQPTKEQVNMLNRSTLNSFYQVQENKKRMLKKIQQQKDRVNDLRLSQAFFITKYGSRFRIDSKILKNN